MANYYGYCRVSSYQQGKKGTISEQVKPVEDYLLKHGVAKKDLSKCIFKDTWTGMTMNRPSFNKLMKRVKNGDTIVVAKLDRLSRDGRKAMNFIEEHPHITFVSLSPSLILSGDSKKSVKLINDIMLLFNQFDHGIVMDRFNSGKSRIRAEIKAGKIHPYNYNGGMPKRFYNVKRRGYYEAIYKYSLSHSLSETGRNFNIAKSTAMRIKRAGKKYHAVKEANND